MTTENTEQFQTAAGEAGEATVEIPEAETEAPQTDETTAPEPVKTEPVKDETPKAATEPPKPEKLGDSPLYKAIRRAESKSDEALRLIKTMLKNSGTLTEEDQAKLESAEKAAAVAAGKVKMATYTEIAVMAGRSGTDLNDPKLREASELYNSGDYEAALESAKAALKGDTMSSEAKPTPKAYATAEEAEQEIQRRVKEELAKGRGKIDIAPPSGGKRIFTQEQIADRAFWEANREEILKAQVEGRIK